MPKNPKTTRKKSQRTMADIEEEFMGNLNDLEDDIDVKSQEKKKSEKKAENVKDVPIDEKGSTNFEDQEIEENIDKVDDEGSGFDLDAQNFAIGVSDRQAAVFAHYMTYTGNEKIEETHYLKTEEFIGDLFPVDLAVFEPNKDFDYYTIGTVGLSEYFFEKGFGRAELLMTLPKTWKPIFDKEEYYWAPELLKDIAYQIIDNKVGLFVGQTYIFAQDRPYSEYTDAIGAIIVAPEMYPIQMLEEKIEGTYTRFLQVVPINKEDYAKLNEMGPKNFINFELHDSDGPLMVAKFEQPKLKGIDKIIKQNEDSLNSK